jgi:ferredoxin/flavodoxin---NADP+ reductase
MSNFNHESVLSVHHWTDNLFSFTTTPPTVTRDAFRNRGRITDLITSGKLFADIGLRELVPEHDRVVICGSPALVADTRALLSGRGFVEGNHGEPAQFVVEKAFAER